MEWRQKEPVKLFSEFDDIHRKLASIHGIADIQRFLHPSEDEMHSPYLLKNIELARDVIVESINTGQKISIYADADNDGVNSTAIMYLYLRRFTKNITYFHTQRSSGHGINFMKDSIPDKTNLLLIVDSSTNDVSACEEIVSRGIEIVILDHHPQESQNDFSVLVNPHQMGCNYPNSQISGAVVVLKMIQVLDDYFNTNYSEDLYDLAAIGMQGDMMSVANGLFENRYIMSEGIKNIKNKGIISLLNELKKDIYKINSTDISYSISPCINSACRMDEIEVILELLIETDLVEAKKLAEKVVKMNKRRQEIQAEHSERLIKLVNPEDKCGIIIDNLIGAGFRGLVAGDFSNKFCKSFMILSEVSEDTLQGSYRGFNDFDLKTVLENIPEVIYAGGHGAAGGCSFKKSDLHKVLDYLNDTLIVENPFLEYVLEFDIDELNEKLIKQIETFYTISGKGFETGKFLIKNIRPQRKDMLGKDKNTVKVSCTPMSKSYFYDDDELLKMTPSATLMKFRTNDEYFDQSLIGKEIEVVGTLNLNVYTNFQKKTTKTVQVFIDDFRVV